MNQANAIKKNQYVVTSIFFKCIWKLPKYGYDL